MNNRLENPFNLVKATDFTDQEILEYWVDLENENAGLFEVLKPSTKMPLLLLGGKGSGKTHLMRYYSTRVQSKMNDNLRTTILQQKLAAVYIAGEGINPERFREADQTEDQWSAVFSMYFELWIATNLLLLLRDSYLDEPDVLPGALISELSQVFTGLFDADFTKIDDLIDELVKFRKEADLVINNAPLTRSLEGISIPFSWGELLYGVPEILAKHVPELANVIFAYLIDEAENFSKSQQRFINTLIRYRRGNATVKVGARLYGIKTYETVGEEPIKQGAEYESVFLDEILREHERAYEQLAKNILLKRLQRTVHLNPSVDDGKVGEFFDELNKNDYWLEVSKKLLKRGKNGRESRPYFNSLSKNLEATNAFSKVDISTILDNLSVPEHPFLEKVCIFVLYKKWPKNAQDINYLSEEIGAAHRALAEGGNKSDYPYSHILDYYASDILAQYHRDYQRRIPYAGLSTLINLSQGIPRNFLIIMKHIHRRSTFAGEEPFRGGKISISAQSDGVRDAADWFWEDAQPGVNGNAVRRSVEALALLFRTIRYSDRPSECSLCSFSLAFEELSSSGKSVLETAENWSYLIRISQGHSNKNTDAIDNKYQLSRMLAPKWDLSENRRGNLELQSDMSNAIFDMELSANLPNLFKKRIHSMSIINRVKKTTQQQELL